MRVVRNDADLLPEIQSARREAKEAFGDGKLLIEVKSLFFLNFLQEIF